MKPEPTPKDFEKAQWRLVEMYFDESVSREEYNGYRSAVCDVFWVAPAALETKLRSKRADLSRMRQDDNHAAAYQFGWGRQ